MTKEELLAMFGTLKEIEFDLINFPYSAYSGGYVLGQQNKTVKKLLENVRGMVEKLATELNEKDVIL